MLFVGLAALIVGVISSVNYLHSADAARETARSTTERAKVAVAGNVEELLQEGRLLVRAISVLPSYLADDQSGERLFSYFRGIATEVPWVYSMFVGFGDGRFVQIINLKKLDGGIWTVPGIPEKTTIALRRAGPFVTDQPRAQEWRFIGDDFWELPSDDAAKTSSYDPRVRPWYKRAIDTGETGASEIYVFSSLQKAGVTISAPMRAIPGAVVGFDAPLDVLANFVKEQKPSKNGLVAIIAEDGTMVAHPDPSKIITRDREGTGFKTVNIKEVADPLLISAFTAIGDKRGFLVKFFHRGEEYFVQEQAITGLPGSSWRLLTIAKIKDFTGPVREGIQKSLTYSLVILVFAVGIAIVIANWIARPLVQSSDFAYRISKLDLSADDPAASPLIEIQRLTGAMAAMRRALNMFLRYAPRDLVHLLVASGKSAEIGGERRRVTLMFTDIENFTSMTEDQSPEEVLMHTSVYFEALTEALIENNGTIDKFMGDAIMAIWNAPADDPDHVDNACLGALAANAASENLNAELCANNFPPLRTRLGLHTGKALVGNMGSPDRMQYTALGPVVNLASRLEGLNKYYGTQVLVSGAVKTAASEGFVFRMLDCVEAKGTSIPVELYELVGTRGPESPFPVSDERHQRLRRYEDAFVRYAARDFEGALAILDELLTMDPMDGASSVLAERCHRFVKMPPPSDWAGVNVFDAK